MKSYSQNNEDLVVMRYFNGKKINVLSIGENDGTTFSNAKLLIENGSHAWLFEPSSVFEDLKELHKDNPKVHCFNVGIGDINGTVKFYESKNHVKGGSDKALVSSTSFEETKRWRDAGVEFIEKEIELIMFSKFLEDNKRAYTYITIDSEGNDWNILKQIDLKQVRCECLCIEWNGDKNLERKFTNYCKKFRFKEIHRNKENLIFALHPPIRSSIS